MRGFVWGNLTVLFLILVALNFPAVRVGVAKALITSSEILLDSVDRDKFDLDYWFDKLDKNNY